MIFYADDDLDDLEVFEQILDELGNPAVTFTSGLALLEKMRLPPPAPTVVFLDVNMPLRSGLEILEEIRANEAWASVPVVMFTTSSDERTKRKSFDLGANYYVTKSASYGDTLESLRHALAIDWATFSATPRNFVYQP